MSFAFLPLYTGDYRRDTQHLTPLKHGIYLLLLFHCWDTRGPLPLDEQEQAGISNCRSADEIEALRYVVRRFFVQMEDGHYNKRMQKEIERAQEISGKRSMAALSRHGLAAAVEVKFGQRKRNARLSDARARGTHSADQWNALVEFHGGCCAKCSSSETMMMKDHIIPLHQGGDDGIGNVQPLCYRCNHGKGADTTDYRKSGWEEHLLACGLQVHASATTPTTTTTPTSTTTPTPTPEVQNQAKSKALRPPRAKKPPGDGAPTAAVWKAYSTSYFEVYNTEPVRNAMVNGQLSNFVGRIGAEEAPGVAAMYPRHTSARYVKAGHPVGLMVQDAEKLRTEWARGSKIGAGSGLDWLQAEINRRKEHAD